jgi:hypothetical protein
LNRAGIGLLVAALLIAVAWMLMGRDPGEPEPAPLEAAASPVPSAGPGADAIAAPDVVSELSGERRALAVEDAGPSRTLTVRVVNKSGGPGVPDASVWLLDWGKVASEGDVALRFDTLRDREADAVAYGTLGVTDRDGSARFVRPELASVHTRLEQAYALGVVGRNTPDELELVLEPDLEVSARVLDANDHPVADAQVSWLIWYSDDARAAISARTGTDGVARLRHLQLRLPAGEGTRHTLALAMPGGTDAQVAFDPAAPPSEPLLLRMPPTGRVEVEVLDADGTPFADGTAVLLQPVISERERARFWDDDSPHARDQDGMSRAWTQGGIARFEHVGLGVRLEALARHAELSTYIAIESDGLRQAGEQLRIVLRLAEAPTALKARLLRPDGSTIAGARINTVLRGDGNSQDRTLTSDDEGRLRLTFDERKFAPHAVRGWWLTHTDGGLTSVFVARVPLVDALGPGDRDLGDVVLGAGGRIADGRVVNESGDPVSGAAVRIWPAGVATIGGPAMPSGMLGATGDDGAFSFQGAAAGDAWSLQARKDEASSAAIAVHAGASGVEIVLPQIEQRVIGRLLLDNDIPLDLLQADWRQSEPQRGMIHVTLHEDGALVCKDPPVGVGDFTLRGRHGNFILASVPAITLDGAPDPRLGPLDLRGMLRHHEIAVTGPAERAPGRLAADFGHEASVVESFLSNPLRFVTPSQHEAITIYAPQAAATRVLLTGGRSEVHLATGISVRWELLGEDWRDAGARVMVTPVQRSGLAGYDCELDAQGIGSGFLPGPGDYRALLDWRFEIDGKTRRHQSLGDALAPDGSEEFHVEPGASSALFRITLKEGALDRALRAIREDS